MTPRVFYNENDPKAVAWLRELMRDGLIPAGEIDTRSIEDVTPDDLRGFTQHHFFAGIGVWPLALRLAGWPDDRPVWSASCPCPPFSSAGRKKACPSCDGTNPIPCPSRTGYFICCLCGHAWLADGRHLLPELWRLTRDHRPDVVFGEQVASGDGRTWLDIVRAAMEMLVYRLGYSDTCAAGFGAPHIRQRLYWVADTLGGELSARASEPHGWAALAAERHGDVGRLALADGGQRHGLADGQGRLGDGPPAGWVEGDGIAAPGGGLVGLADDGERQQQYAECHGEPLARGEASAQRHDSGGRGGPGRMDHPGGFGRTGGAQPEHLLLGDPGRARPHIGPATAAGPRHGPGPTNGLWRAADWLRCRDEKWRPVEPGSFPLADAGTFRNRVAELRGAGNAVNLAQAQGFIEAYLAAERDGHLRLTGVSEMTADMDVFA